MTADPVAPPIVPVELPHTLTSCAWNARVTALLDRAEHTWVLLLVDLDRFAASGHAAADHVLARVAAAVHEAVPDGVMGRFGRDQLVVLVRGVDGDAGRPGPATAEAVRRAVADLDVAVDGPDGRTRVRGVTASVGAAVPRSRAPVTAMLWAADRALYAAKRAGGDAVRVRAVE